MLKIVLVSCVKKKLPYRAKARDMYISPLFNSHLNYALSLKPDAIFILSAKYGLVSLDQEIEPYDLTLNNKGVSQRKEWAQKVLADLRMKADLLHDHFIFLAGMKYREFLLPSIHSYEIPLEGYPIGKLLQELKRRTSE